MELHDLSLLPNAPGKLGYLNDARFAPKVRGPVITTRTLASLIPTEHVYAIDEDPEAAFWSTHEELGRKGFFGEHPPFELGEGCDVHPSAVLGKVGFEIHANRLIPHFGYVRLGDRVTVGANTSIDRSLWKEPTSVGDDTHIDNLVHVAHNVRIGKRCMLVAGTVLGGSTVIEDDVFLGIGALTRPGVRIGAGAFIGMGVVVLRDVAPGERLVVKERQ